MGGISATRLFFEIKKLLINPKHEMPSSKEGYIYKYCKANTDLITRYYNGLFKNVL
jgi:hypothetical protein